MASVESRGGSFSTPMTGSSASRDCCPSISWWSTIPYSATAASAASTRSLRIWLTGDSSTIRGSRRRCALVLCPPGCSYRWAATRTRTTSSATTGSRCARSSRHHSRADHPSSLGRQVLVECEAGQGPFLDKREVGHERLHVSINHVAPGVGVLDAHQPHAAVGVADLLDRATGDGFD